MHSTRHILRDQLREIEDWLAHHADQDHAHLPPEIAAAIREAAKDSAARLRRLLYPH